MNIRKILYYIMSIFHENKLTSVTVLTSRGGRGGRGGAGVFSVKGGTSTRARQFYSGVNLARGAFFACDTGPVGFWETVECLAWVSEIARATGQEIGTDGGRA